MDLNIVPLDESLEDRYGEMVFSDPVDYYFFILDWKHLRSKTDIFLAMDGENIEGAMIIYDKNIAAFRGSPRTIRPLMRKIVQEEIDITAPLEHKEILHDRYEAHTSRHMFILVLRKGKESYHVKEPSVVLTEEDAEELEGLLSASNPAPWVQWTAAGIKDAMKDSLWLGIKIDGKVVSVAMTRFYEFGSNIYLVATHPDYLNKGYATSVVSDITKRILERSRMAVIHVFADNPPAVKAYAKVGFKPHRSYILMGKARKKKIRIILD